MKENIRMFNKTNAMLKLTDKVLGLYDLKRLFKFLMKQHQYKKVHNVKIVNEETKQSRTRTQQTESS